MKRWIVVFVMVCLVLVPTYSVRAHVHEALPIPEKKVMKFGKNTLQGLIDDTEAGGTLYLEDRVYRGTFMITKPITIIGQQGTALHSLETVLIISDTEDVTLKNVSIEGKQAMFIEKASRVILEDVHIEQVSGGIYVTESSDLTFERLRVTGEDGHFSEKQHAVAVFKSKHFTANASDIRNVMDGFYLESTYGVTLTNSHVENSRYAMHMMYSDHVRLHDNTLVNNMTGFMVMVAEDIMIERNRVLENHSLNSLGVYAYDLRHVVFRDNELAENMTAMDIQQVKNMRVFNNIFTANGTALQVERSPSLVVEHNEFAGNILTSRTDAEGFTLTSNVYDDYDGRDYDGDGIGDTTYAAANAFGQWMVRKPVYQYFMGSPSVVVLDMMESAEQATGVVDTSPRIATTERHLQFDMKTGQLLISASLIGALWIARRKLG
ncbi:right-handed parallel beta-helix repeat-containing protein [Caryophanon tenue]|uniref:right-handed parallel beta-helix repeat-containing protein n=1 Tax=Caryophanon tenue TaxID=33978 RepID=UPI00082A6446|nr:right-handed parallel beta-helix repeat-containing protein [Caryophanon tenue]